MATTFPFGYSGKPQGMGQLLTWEQMMTKKTVYNLHPEVRRRFHRLIEAAASQGVPLGVGTGWRVQPNPPPPGFAKPGNSWHESCPVSPQSATAFAIDTVPNVSWGWLGQHCAAYGFRVFTNVNNEPWHIQPLEISVSRKYATTPPALGTWNLPGAPLPPVVVPPSSGGGTFTLELQKNELTPDKREQLRGNGDVYLIQQIAQGHYKQLGNTAYDCGKPDGDYGPKTQGAVRQIQADGGLDQDACCGPATWGYILNKTGG
jgi:Putative peptidoglycan binding domain